MSEYRNWQLELGEYIRQDEPEQAEKSAAWKTAIGLQAVDGLQTSTYLLETAKEHIEGKINIQDVQNRIESYYESRSDRQNVELENKEADIVSSRITALLSERTFQFSPAEWQSIHRRLFDGVFQHAGQIRTYNITKKEWVLDGDTVLYASYDSIRAAMDYDFRQEKIFSYAGLSVQESVRHIVKFASDIWQIHPFGEGNTRATAVFIIKYLQSFGFHVGNEAFADHSWYFRNALVRANYSNMQRGITATIKFLDLFFENLLLDTQHELKNRYLHIDFPQKAEESRQSATVEISKCNLCTLNELALLKVVRENPSATQKELSETLGVSVRTIKTLTVTLQEKGLLLRVNGKRNGRWEIQNL